MGFKFFKDDDTENDDTPKVSLEDTELRLTENAPPRIFHEVTGCFEYKDPELREIADNRRKNHINDILKNRLDGLKKHLRRAGLEENIGKTGDPSTAEVSEQDKKVASIQTEHAKEYILRNRKQR